MMGNAYDTLHDIAWKANRAGHTAITFDGDMQFWQEFQSDPRTLNSVNGFPDQWPKPDHPFKWYGVSVTVSLPKPHEQVVVRRKRDGQWLRRNDGKGRLVLFMEGLPPLKLSRQDATDLIRIDMGRDLDEFEMLTMTQYEGLTTPVTLNK